MIQDTFGSGMQVGGKGMIRLWILKEMCTSWLIITMRISTKAEILQLSILLHCDI